MLNLWVDDVRDPKDFVLDYKEDNWVWVTDGQKAIKILEEQDFYIVSLDHDMGMDYHMNGYYVVYWLAENNKWPPVLNIHSANYVGVEKMIGMAERYGNYESQSKDRRTFYGPNAKADISE